MSLRLRWTFSLVVAAGLLQLACSGSTPTSPARVSSAGTAAAAAAGTESSGTVTPYRRVGDVGGGGGQEVCTVEGLPGECPKVDVSFLLRAADGSTLSGTCRPTDFTSQLVLVRCSLGRPGDPTTFVGTGRLRGAEIPEPTQSGKSGIESLFELSESSLYLSLVLSVTEMGDRDFLIQSTLQASTLLLPDEQCSSGIRVLTQAASALEQLGWTTVEVSYCKVPSVG